METNNKGQYVARPYTDEEMQVKLAVEEQRRAGSAAKYEMLQAKEELTLEERVFCERYYNWKHWGQR